MTGTASGTIPAAELLQAYRTMRTIRDFEERVYKEFQTGQMPGFVHLYAGEEAVATGVCDVLTPADYIASTHRGHGHAIAKGCDVVAMMAELYGKATGTCKGKGGSMHIADLSTGMLGANGIVGGGPPLVCGVACRPRCVAPTRSASRSPVTAARTRAPSWRASTSPPP